MLRSADYRDQVRLAIRVNNTLLSMLHCARLTAVSLRHQRSLVAHKPQNVAVALYAIGSFSPHLVEVLQYYKRQQIEHAYVGLILDESKHGQDEYDSLAKQYQSALAGLLASGFVSLGWIPTPGVTSYGYSPGSMLHKMLWMTSVLFNAKSFNAGSSGGR